MYEFLRNHAAKNVWCNPEQDNQIILAAKRITRREGELVSFPLMKRRVDLPTKDRLYHVFQVGQAHPTILGLLPRNPGWTQAFWKPFSLAVNQLDVHVDIYSDAGVHIPLHRAYYMYSDDRALVIAIDETSKSAVDYQNDQLYFRLYTNAYYESSQANSLVYRTRAGGQTIFANADVVTLQVAIAPLKQLPGHVFSFVNGHLVNDINLTTVQVGDVVEYYYDGSVKNVFEFKVEDLLTFSSELDNCLKYLIHPPGNTGQIDYVDDIDVYIVSRNGERFKGRYFHKNQAEAFRMVTHRDYSLRVESFEVIASGLAEWLSSTPVDIRSFSIQLYVRHSGMIRPLIYDHQRIFELYKLSDEQIVSAMVGVDASMPYWTAAALENSGYAELMRVDYRSIDIEHIERAYGYNSMTRVIGDLPIRTKSFNSVQVAELPPAYYTDSTVFEYDLNGVLLGWGYHDEGTVYYPSFEQTRMIEVTCGRGSHAPSVVEGTDNLPVPADNSYRVYMCYLVGIIPNNEWVDITSSELYTVVNGHVVWQNMESDQWLQVRTDEHFICYDMDLTAIAGTYYFDLSEVINGNLRIMRIPTGDMDIWFNGKILIPTLDYFVDFPRVYIVNKEHIVQPSETVPQKITVRMTGFADSDLKMRVPEDYGFIEHGFLSNNTRFDVRDDKVLHISVRGSLRHRDDVQFSELTQGVSVVNALNGSPYQIKDVIIPLEGLAEEETYRLRQKSLDVDQAVEDYMTLKLPQPERNAVNAIPARYMLVSPFFSHIANDLSSRDFNMAALEAVLSDDDVLALCEPYESLLTYDPINPENQIDHRYVVIHPTERVTALSLDLYSYRFMQRVVALYGRGLISLSPHLVVSLGGN